MYGRIAITCTLIALINSTVAAGDVSFDIDWYSIDAGGGVVVGPTWQLTGTIGQPDAAPTAVAGVLELIPGFMAIAQSMTVVEETSIFQSIGTLSGEGNSSGVWGISGDGKTVVGYSLDDGVQEAIRWSQASGLVGLGFVPGGDDSTYAQCASFNGWLIGGAGVGEEGSAAWTWSEATGLTSIVPPGADQEMGFYPFNLRGMSADGGVLVGQAIVDGEEMAFRWSETEGFVALGDLPGSVVNSAAFAASGDGNVVVGRSVSDNGTEAFRWTQESGMVAMGDLPGGSFGSSALGVSADGSTIVGNASDATGSVPFRWTELTGMVSLGGLPGGDGTGNAYDVSANGGIVVGASDGPNGIEASIWNSTDGMRSVKEVLENNFGIDLTGWHLERAEGISDNGCVLAGRGVNPDGIDEGWVARLVLEEFANQDADCDVDLDDFEIVVECLTGPGQQPSNACAQADVDGDGFVDLRDAAALANTFTGG